MTSDEIRSRIAQVEREMAALEERQNECSAKMRKLEKQRREGSSEYGRLVADGVALHNRMRELQAERDQLLRKL